ncbi:SDR family oxidoreductase [Marinibaculum pumilum]|uniref:SDR family oxidoreductase n=1 Tax=Marinibaculum pumilum TaxID=1766165 RepID=A0ABV7KX54_9PROT
MSISFDGRVAIVTGAGAGLGRSHAMLLASRGAKVVVNDLGGAVDGTSGSAAPADKVVDEIKAAGGEAVANYDSVSDPAGAANIVKTAVDAFGKVDILVNNAGILRDRSFTKMDAETWNAVVAVHLNGTAYVTMAAWPVMRENGYGRIVLTASNSGLYGNFGQANYGAAKAGMVGLMNVLKQEGRKYNILVNTLAPMATTRMTEELMPPEAVKLLQPELVSPGVAYLCSETNEESGIVLSAGGGYFARIQVMGSEGVFMEPGTEVTPEMVADQFAKICDMSNAQNFDSSTAELQYLFSKQIKGGVGHSHFS